jgi:hypothetical protein
MELTVALVFEVHRVVGVPQDLLDSQDQLDPP